VANSCVHDGKTIGIGTKIAFLFEREGVQRLHKTADCLLGSSLLATTVTPISAQKKNATSKYPSAIS